MTHEQAYQASIDFFRAGKNGAPMPPIANEAHRALLEKLYANGRKAGRHPKLPK